MPIDTVIHTNQHSIDRVLNAGVPVVLVFWQEKISAAEQMDPLLSDLAARYAGKALIAKIETSTEPSLAQQYNVSQIPTLVFVKEGATEATISGAISQRDLDDWLTYLVDGGTRPATPSGPAASTNGTPGGGSSGGGGGSNGNGKPITLTDANFQQTISASGPVLVDFWAPWCGPCRMVAPAVEELAQEFAGRAVVGKLNVDENPRTSQQYGIMSIPALYIFKNGQPVDQIVGAQPAHVLRQRLMAQM
mgnify:FL=1